MISPHRRARMPAAIAAAEPQMKSGVAVYQANCVGCHGWDGKGERHLFPPLAGNAIVQQDSVETLARVVLAGARAAQTREAPDRPGDAVLCMAPERWRGR